MFDLDMLYNEVLWCVMVGDKHLQCGVHSSDDLIYCILEERHMPTINLSTSSLAGCHRVRVVRTRPCRRTPRCLVCRHNLNYRTVCTPDHQESTDDNDEDAPGHHKLPLDALFGAAPVVVEPHEAHRLEGHKGSQ